MDFKGTKEEWKAIYKPKTDYYLGRYEIQFSDDGECVAEIVHNRYDAQLIASAPDLLKACNMARIEIENGRADQTTIRVLENAINKALGKNILNFENESKNEALH
ncbi:MAG: hypothetical protein ACK5LM_07750 [Lactovum sp.]